MIQFYHNTFPSLNENKFTVCLTLPSKEELLELIKNPTKSIEMELGYSICSKSDNFSRHIGRELSNSRKKQSTFHLEYVSANIKRENDKIEYRHTLILFHENIKVTILLTHNCSRPKLIEAYID